MVERLARGAERGGRGESLILPSDLGRRGCWTEA